MEMLITQIKELRKNIVNMTLKEKLIKRLNKGFGYNIPLDSKWKTNQAHGNYVGMGAHSWYFCDLNLPFSHNVGSSSSVKECLKWDRWIIDPRRLEISEYNESLISLYRAHDYLIEKL
jgi:hypothetical protein